MQAVCQVCDHGPWASAAPSLGGREATKADRGDYVENATKRTRVAVRPPGVTATLVQTWRAARPTRKRDRRL